MTKVPTPTEKSKQQRGNIKNATKNFDYTTISDRLRTVRWSNSTLYRLTYYERLTLPCPQNNPFLHTTSIDRKTQPVVNTDGKNCRSMSVKNLRAHFSSSFAHTLISECRSQWQDKIYPSGTTNDKVCMSFWKSAYQASCKKVQHLFVFKPRHWKAGALQLHGLLLPRYINNYERCEGLDRWGETGEKTYVFAFYTSWSGFNMSHLIDVARDGKFLPKGQPMGINFETVILGFKLTTYFENYLLS